MAYRVSWYSYVRRFRAHPRKILCYFQKIVTKLLEKAKGAKVLVMAENIEFSASWLPQAGSPFTHSLKPAQMALLPAQKFRGAGLLALWRGWSKRSRTAYP